MTTAYNEHSLQNDSLDVFDEIEQLAHTYFDLAVCKAQLW